MLDEPKPTRFQSALMWIATISLPLAVAAIIVAALAYVLWVLSHFNIQ